MRPLPNVPSRALLLLAGALLGCRAEAPGLKNAPAWLAAPAEPVRLTLTYDSANTVSKRIGPAGGTISAQGEDGAYYELRIPKGALADEQRVTMTPVKAVRGLPLKGGAAAAVSLQPEGLRLMRPATLLVESATDVPVAEQVPFGYFGDGEDAYLYPPSPDAEGVELKLFHFSGYGFGRAAPGDPGIQALQNAANYEARMQARVAEVIGKERAKALLGEDAATKGEKPEVDGDVGAFLTTTAIEYYDAVLRPMMRTAETDDRMAECCVARYLAWERQIQLLGMSGDPDKPPPDKLSAELRRREDEARASFQRIFTNALDKGRDRAIARCRQHDFTAIQTLVSLERTAQLMGFGGESGYNKRLYQDIDDCLHFEVAFTSWIANDGPRGVQEHFNIASQLDFTLPILGREKPELGTAPMRYTTLVMRGNLSKALFGDVPAPTDGDQLGQYMAHGLSASDVTQHEIGSVPGELSVYGLELEHHGVARPGTNCEGRDFSEQGDSISVDAVLVGIRPPKERVRVTIRGGPPSTSESAEWHRFWLTNHRELQARFPGVTAEEDTDGEYATTLYRLPLKAVEAGVWRFQADTADAAHGWSGNEHSKVEVRHTPR